MPDYQFTRFPIPGKRVDFESIQNEITTLQERASELQQQLDALTESAVPETRTVNGLDLSEDRTLKSAQFAESVTGEKMLANLLYSQVSTWDSGAKKSIKMAGDTYVDESDVMLDSSSSSRKTIAQARVPVSFSLTYSFTPGTLMGGCYYNPLTREVHINILVYSSSQLIPGQGAIIATIPSDYRPLSTLETHALVSASDYLQGAAEGVFIYTDGTIACRNFLVGQNMKVFALNVTYMI